MINEVLDDLYNFVETESTVKGDFQEYLRTIGGKNNQENSINYIFERRLGENSKSILDIFTEKTKNLTKQAKLVLAGLKNAQSSIFQVKKIMKNGFELYNLVNEKLYRVVSLKKMTQFRGIGIGQYVVARVFEYENEYYLLEISGVLPTNRKEEALRYAIAKIVQNPSLVYKDNKDKLLEIESDIKNMYEKFVEFFGSDEVLTTNKYADEIIGLFNDFVEKGVQIDIKDKIQQPESYKYFEVKEFHNTYDNFIENSLGGFSSHKEIYDVGIIFDKELGLYAIPFYETFNRCFSQEIENSTACIKFFMFSETVSDAVLKRIVAKNKNFIEVVNKSLGENLTLEELLKKYKSEFLENKILSSTTVLFSSKTFTGTLEEIEEKENKPVIENKKIGRNDPCPCGSGKKYKNCCLV